MRRHAPLHLFALILLATTLTPTATAQQGKTATELWLDAHRDPNQKTYFGELIDLSLRDADLVETLRTFAEVGRFNLVIQPGVKGTVTVELKQVPWDQALEQILKINGLAMDITGGRVDVTPRTGRTQSTHFGLVTVRLKPVHADAGVIARALDHPMAGVPTPGGTIRAEGDTLILRDTRASLQDFARVLSYIDVPSAAEETPESLARRCIEVWNRHVPERPIGR